MENVFHDPYIKERHIVSRIMEHKVTKQLTTYLMDRELVSTIKRGFLQNESCDTCMTGSLNTIKTAANTGKSALIVYLDMTEPFDRVSRRMLIKK